ncbi:MAG: menaquinone biosynthesis protein [Chloroflexi bacterium]|nr:menaquinone biosynthesis protein [Chloroflexota bacterium]
MRIRVGRMPYLNSDVFYRALPAEAADLVDMPPRAMAAATERGELDAGPLPMAEVLRMGDQLVPIGDYCVATMRESTSILFFSRAPAEQLRDARIAVTDHTSSSVQLLRVLFAERWLVAPGEYVGLDEEHDAALVIGDPALQARNGLEGFPHVYDLGAEWYNHTRGLPFVYARWMARRDAEPGMVADFAAALERAYEQGMELLEEIAGGRPELGMSQDEKLKYLQGFSYRLGAPEFASLDRFRKSLARLPQWRPGESESISA